MCAGDQMTWSCVPRSAAESRTITCISSMSVKVLVTCSGQAWPSDWEAAVGRFAESDVAP